MEVKQALEQIDMYRPFEGKDLIIEAIYFAVEQGNMSPDEGIEAVEDYEGLLEDAGCYVSP